MDAEYLNERLKCDYNDKVECLKFVKSLLDLVDIYVEKGIDSLEYEINNNEVYNMPLMKRGISLICDGRNPEVVKNIIYNYIVFSDYTGVKFLKNIIAADTLILIHHGENPYSILNLISSYFGLEFYDSFQKFYDLYDKKYKITVEEVESKYKNTKPFSENTLILESYLEVLKNECENMTPSSKNALTLGYSLLSHYMIITALEECSTYELTYALRGANGEIKISFLSNMFKYQRYMMNYYISKADINDYEREIIYCQKQVLKVMKSIIR